MGFKTAKTSRRQAAHPVRAVLFPRVRLHRAQLHRTRRAWSTGSAWTIPTKRFLGLCLVLWVPGLLIPTETLATTFVNVNSTVAPSMSNGKVAWGDFNKDGFVDMGVGVNLHTNMGGTSFQVKHAIGGNGVFGDYDSDGFLDWYSYGTSEIYRNMGGAGLTPAGTPAINNPPPVSQAASWGDHDNDGDLDLYVGGYETWSLNLTYADLRYRNEAGTSLVDIWTQPTPRPGRGISSADFDRDGDLDIYVSNYRLVPNELHVNDGAGNFTDRAADYNATGGSGHTIGSSWGDLDNDGEIDLFVGNFSHNRNSQPGVKFLKNTGSPGGYGFQSMLEWNYASSPNWQESYASPTLGDYDNDGDLDLFLTTVYGGDHSRLYRNDGNWNFTDVTSSAGLDGITPTYQAAFADYDNDGDLDLAAGGILFRNEGNDHNWLKLKMVGDGITVNRDAVGAQVRIEAGGETFTRQVESGTGEGNQNDPTLHFGLGTMTGPVDLDILWPGGQTGQIENIALNQVHTIEFTPPPPPLTDHQWVPTTGGSWHTPANWSSGTVPNSHSAAVQLTGVTATAIHIELGSPVTVARLELDDATSYQLSASLPEGRLQLETASTAAELNVLAGQHTLALPVVARSDTLVDVPEGASITLANTVDFDGVTLTKTGGGLLRVPAGSSSGSGTVQLNEGTLDWRGDLRGDLSAAGGTITPAGASRGRLDVRGSFALGEGASLELDIRGLSSSSNDLVTVDSQADLAGTLEIDLHDGFRPAPGSQLLVMLAGSLTDNGLTVGGPDGHYFQTVAGSSTLLLEAVTPGSWQWTGGSGDWNASANWDEGSVPNSNSAVVQLTGSVATTSLVQLPTAVTLRELSLDQGSSYWLLGTGELHFDGPHGQADALVTGGNHRWDVEVHTHVDTALFVNTAAALTIAGPLHQNGFTVTKEGQGTLVLDGVASSGNLEVTGGTLAGDGTVGGDLIAHSGQIAPGSGIGRLDVGGDFTLGAAATLQIEIAGPSSKDVLFVSGAAELAGSLEVVLTDSYQPELGQNFLVLLAGSVTDSGLTLSGPRADEFALTAFGSGLILESLFAGLAGDYNGDGTVDAADYVVWRDSLGESLPAGTGADGDRSGIVDQLDYELWKANFGTTGATSIAVPEPTGAMLLVTQLAICLAGLRRQTLPRTADLARLCPLSAPLQGNP